MSTLPAPPPPSQRQLPSGEPRNEVEDGLLLLALHGALLEALTSRNPADFQPLPIDFLETGRRLQEVLRRPELLPPPLVAGLAPLLTPRLIRLRQHLRRRLARTRNEVPLRRVREMDPACLRVNARKPGRTLLEKAGPRQMLRALVRVERYDTSENRILRAACVRLQRTAQSALQGVPRSHERTDPQVRQLRALGREAAALIECEELRTVGLPRPDERPSNALLGDADYRAVWRALQLLRGEEERFIEEWRSLERVLDEVLLVAAWCHFDAQGKLDPFPGWVRPLHRQVNSKRLESDRHRRWVRFGQEQVEEWSVLSEPGGLIVSHRRWKGTSRQERTFRVEGAFVQAAVGPLGTRLKVMLASETHCQEYSADRSLLPAMDAVFGELNPARSALAPLARRELQGRVAVSALDATLRIMDDAGPFDAGPSAVVTIPAGGSLSLDVVGRSATLGGGDVAGPLALHGPHVERYSRLLHRWKQRAVTELAVVVPDRFDEGALQRLRMHAGACWAVWQPVAVALQLGEQEPQRVTPPPGKALRMLVIALSDAANDVALLSCEAMPGGERVWLRERAGQALPSGEALRFEPVEAERREPLRAAWLRQPSDAQAWVQQGENWVLSPLPRPGDQLDRHLLEAARTFSGKGIDLVAIAGAGPELEERLRQGLAPLPLVFLSSDAAVRGARVFLERYRAGRPTWRDRLPALTVEVREENRRKHVDVVPEGSYAEPGRPLSFVSAQTLILEAGKDAFDLRMLRERQVAPFKLRLEGPPLPLSQPVTVRISVRFRYGLEDMEGRLEPYEAAPFERIPFRLQGAEPEEGDREEPSGPPEYNPPPLLEKQALKHIQEASEALAEWWRKLSIKERKQAKTNAGLLKDDMLPLVEELEQALRAVQGSGPASLSQEGRQLLEDLVAPRLDWLLGLRRSPDKDGEAPALTDKAKLWAVRARSRAGIRGDGRFASFLMERMKEAKGGTRTEWWRGLGRIVDGRADGVWDVIVGFEPSSDDERRSLGNAILWALQAHPELAPHLGEARARATLTVLTRELGRLEKSERRKDHFAFLLQSLMHLCRCRVAGLLPPEDPQVRETVAFLRELRQQLPEEVLRQAVRSTAQDEPLSMAIDALEGRIVTLPLAGRET